MSLRCLFLFISLFLIESGFILAQEIHTLSVHNREQAKVLLSSNSQFLLLGETIENDKKSILFTRVDAKGNVIHSKILSANDPLVVVDAMPTNDGFLLTAENYVQSRESLMLVNTDNTGNVNWVRTNNENGNEVEPYAMAKSGEHYFIGGFTKIATVSVNSFYNYKVEEQFPYLLKIDSKGKKIWSKQIKLSDKQVVGDIRDIVTTSENDLIFIANVYDFESKTKTLMNYLVKVNTDGAIIWSKELKEKNTEFLKLKLDDDGNIFLAGKQTLDKNNVDVVLLKLNSSGEAIWSNRIGKSKIEIPSDLMIVHQTVYLSASSSSLSDKNQGQAVLFKFNTDGKLLDNMWINKYDFSKIPTLTYSSGKVYFAGATIKMNQGIKMDIIFGTPNFNSTLIFSPQPIQLTFENTSIDLENIESGDASTINEYKILVKDETISTK